MEPNATTACIKLRTVYPIFIESPLKGRTMTSVAYANIVSPDDKEVVTRYLTMSGLVWMLGNAALPLIRLDRFSDPCEGSIPVANETELALLDGSRRMHLMQVHANAEWYPGAYGVIEAHRKLEELPDIYERLARTLKAQVGSTFASCWRLNKESEAMWRLFCGDKEGLALQTTVGKLRLALDDPDLLIGKVQYRDYGTCNKFEHQLDYVFHKRDGFETEQEVRLLKVNDEMYQALLDEKSVAREVSISLKWRIQDGVDKVLVSPYAASWYLDAVKSVLNNMGAEPLDQRVEFSSLQRPPRWGNN
jgi:hypothetical protein